MSRWISVKDRLPDATDYYLGYGDLSVDIRFYDNGGFHIYIHDDWEPDYSVTHWMPLPEPPKGDTI